jgi:antitoxin VapB
MEEQTMLSSKVFISGNSQAIRLPKEYQVEEKELYIQKIGSTIILFPKTNPWETFENSLTEFTDDFMKDGRNQPKMQEREGL